MTRTCQATGEAVLVPRIPRASKLLICGLFQKGRVLAQDGMTRAYRSSNTPFNPAPATKPGSANSERIDWEFFTRLAYPKNGPLFST